MSIVYVISLIAAGILQVLASNSSEILTVSTQKSDIPSTRITIHGSVEQASTQTTGITSHSTIDESFSTTLATPSSSTLNSYKVIQDVLTTHYASFTTTGVQSSTDLSSVNSTSAYVSNTSQSISSLSYGSVSYNNYTRLTETIFDQRLTTTALTILDSAISSSSSLTPSLKMPISAGVSSSEHVVGLSSTVKSSFIHSVLSTEMLPSPPVLHVISSTLATPPIQCNSNSGSDIKTILVASTSDTTLHPSTYSSLISFVSETVMPTHSRGDNLNTSLTIKQKGQGTLSSTEATIQTFVEQTFPASSLYVIQTVSISDIPVQSSSTQTLTHMSDSALSGLAYSAGTFLNSTLVASKTQIQSSDPTPDLPTTVTPESVILLTQNSFNTASLSHTSASLTVSLSSSLFDSDTLDIKSSLTPSMSSEAVSVMVQSTIESKPYSFETTSFIPPTLTGMSHTLFPVALPLSTVESSHNDIIPSVLLSFDSLSSLGPIQHTASNRSTFETRVFSTTKSSSVPTLVSNIQSTALFNTPALQTRQGLSSSILSNTLQPSFSASAIESSTVRPVIIRPTGIEISTSSRIVEMAYKPESVLENISTISIPRITSAHSSIRHVSTVDRIHVSPSPSSSLHVVASVSADIKIIADLKFIFDLEGDCDRMILNAQLQIEFWQALIAVLSIHSTVHIPTEKVQPEDLTCKPFQAIFILKKLDHTDYVKLTEGNLTITQVGIPILDDMSVIEYEVKSYQVIPVAKKSVDKPKEVRLDKEDIVIIAVACALFGLLTFMCIAIACRECYRKRRAASFNLLDVPRVSLDMDDFTLTKIPRPKLIYSENNSVSTRTTPVHNGNPHLRPKHLPVDDVNSAETLRIRPISTDSIQVRIQPHPDGVVVGVTCTPPRSPTREYSNSEHSSPRSEVSEPAKQTLLKNGNHPHYGVSNPNFDGDENSQGVKGRKFVINEDEDEALL